MIEANNLQLAVEVVWRGQEGRDEKYEIKKCHRIGMFWQPIFVEPEKKNWLSGNFVILCTTDESADCRVRETHTFALVRCASPLCGVFACTENESL